MRILVSFLLTVGLFSNQVLAAETQIKELDSKTVSRINYLLDRHKPAHVRPAPVLWRVKAMRIFLVRLKI